MSTKCFSKSPEVSSWSLYEPLLTVSVNLITYYLPNVLQNEVGLSDFLSRLIAACNGTEYFLASWIAVFTIEKIGRRKLMLFGAAGMSGCMVILAITASIANAPSGIASTVFLFGFNTFFASKFCNVLDRSLEYR